MVGLTRDVWQICIIIFVLLLPYVVLKRPLWFPGMVTMGYFTFGYAKLTPVSWGPIRVYHLLLIAGILIIALTFLKRNSRVVKQANLGFVERAPVYLVFLLFLMGLRMVSEYINTELEIFRYEIPDLFIATILPCLVILFHPARDDALQEILLGIAFGAMLALLPAFMDFDELSSIWVEFISGSSIHFARISYKDKNTLASWAVQGGIAFFYLSLLKKNTKRNRIFFLLALFLASFVIFTQSRRWILSLMIFTLIFYFLWLREGELLTRNVAIRRYSKQLLGTGIGIVMGFIVYQIFRSQSRFERLSIDLLTSELGPSQLVLAGYSRGDLWRLAIDTWSHKPLLGVGLSGFGWRSLAIESGTGSIISRHIGAHNLAADILVQFGIVGAILSIFFIIFMVRFLIKWILSNHHNKIRRELLLLSIFWVSLFSVSLSGGWASQKLLLLAVIPCTAYLIIKNNSSILNYTYTINPYQKSEHYVESQTRVLPTNIRGVNRGNVLE